MLLTKREREKKNTKYVEERKQNDYVPNSLTGKPKNKTKAKSKDIPNWRDRSQRQRKPNLSVFNIRN